VTREIAWVTDPGRFAELSGEWDALLPAVARPFDLHCWYMAWWSAFGDGDELAVCTARRNGELVGAFPLRSGDAGIGPLANVHTPSFRPLARDPEAMEQLVTAAIERNGRRGVQMIALPAEDPSVARLASGAREASMVPFVEPAYASPTVDTAGDFDAWRAQSKRRWGAPLERFRRKMGRDFAADFTIVEPPAELEAELDDGFRVEASGWKGRAGTAILSDPATEAFYREVAREFERRGELRISRIELDGRTAAFDLCVLHDARLYLLKTGFDEDFRRLAPGLVMRLSIIERCFELGLRSHELLGGESEWKAKFETGKHPHVTLHAYRRNPVGLARYAYRSTVRPSLKRVYRKLKRRQP
jgi:CelD/BcsL family acetyltransferase involved in cellulose biosynthesis